MRPLVIIESPYRGNGESRREIEDDVAINIGYARLCLRNSMRRGESPFASHLLYTQDGVLDDFNREERKQGMSCGLDWARVANYAVFYTDRGWSPGMLDALIHYTDTETEFRIRSLLTKEAIELPKLSSRTIINLLKRCED